MLQYPHLNTKERCELRTTLTSTNHVMSAYTSPNPFTRQHRLQQRLKTKGNRTVAYFGRVTFKVPTGRISIDFPQNLFFHLISEYNSERFTKLKRPKSPPCSDLCVTQDALCYTTQFKTGQYEVAMKIQKKKNTRK